MSEDSRKSGRPQDQTLGRKPPGIKLACRDHLSHGLTINDSLRLAESEAPQG